MNNSITAETLPSVTHNSNPVITTELLAQLYAADVKHIQNNYLRNSERFTIGKHYFKLEGAELKDFKNKPSLRGLVASRAKHLILWTERGAARHAKMLETDQAWEVFEKLEDHYFNKKEEAEPVRKTRQSTAKQLTPLRQTVERLIATGIGQIYPDVWKLVHKHFDVEHITQLHPEQIDEAIEYLNVLEGEYLGKQEPTPEPKLHIHFPITWWNQFNHALKSRGVSEFSHTNPCSFPVKMLFGDSSDSPSAISKLLLVLTRAGYDVNAARLEHMAHRHYVEIMHHKLERIGQMSESITCSATSFRISPR